MKNGKYETQFSPLFNESVLTRNFRFPAVQFHLRRGLDDVIYLRHCSFCPLGNPSYLLLVITHSLQLFVFCSHWWSSSSAHPLSIFINIFLRFKIINYRFLYSIPCFIQQRESWGNAKICNGKRNIIIARKRGTS